MSGIQKKHRQGMQAVRWGVLFFLLAFVTACATPIGIQRVDPRSVHQTLTANVLSTGELGPFTVQLLRRLNLYDKFADDPAKVLAELHRGLKPKGDEDRLIALAELSFFHAEQSEDPSYYLACVVYAYSYLFPGAHGTPPAPGGVRHVARRIPPVAGFRLFFADARAGRDRSPCAAGRSTHRRAGGR